MSIATPPHTDTPTSKARHASESEHPTIFTDIYREDINIVIWQRQLPPELQQFIGHFLKSNPSFRLSATVTPQNVYAIISQPLHDAANIESNTELGENITELVDMFCYLFELKQVGLRMTALDSAMCPRFHVDRVPCRLVTTFQGAATEWLPHSAVDRTKLGTGNQGLPDEASGLFQNQKDIRQLNSGDVALLKGELWQGNENAGLVHRSPAVSSGEQRLLLTLDFVN